MSFYDDASLIMYPSGYKEDKIYSLKPTNGTGDLNFTRASSATRVNAEGLIETPSVLGSELVVNGDFATDSDWTKGTGWTISGGTANGTGSVISSIIQQPTYIVGRTYKLTFTISNRTAGTIRPFIGVTSGLFYTSNGTFSENIVYSSGTDVNIQKRDSFNGSIDNVSVKEVITSNVPRIDYSNGCGSLLLEPQRTNLITYSEDFSNAYWTKSGSSVTSGFTSPDGTANAFKLVEDSSIGNHVTLVSISNFIGDVTMSIFAKKGERNWIKIANNQELGAYFDLQNGVVGTTDVGFTTNIENYGNGWYKCSLSSNRAVSATESLITYTSIDGINTSYQGDGASGLYIFGAQLEQGSFPTSYIKSNSGSTTTRSAETANGAGDATTFNDSEGVLMVEMSAFEYPVTQNNWLTITDGSINNSIDILFESTGAVVARHEVGGVNYSYLTHTIDYTNVLKVAFKYKLNDLQLWINGYKVSVLSNSPIFPNNTLNSLQLQYGGGSNTFYGKTKQIQYYNSALTDSEIETLTSWTSFTAMAQGQTYSIK